MKVQSIMDDNKAMDERTAKDKLEAERAAALEIEENFPSYFDELSKQMVAITATLQVTDQEELQGRLSYKAREVPINDILFELAEIEDEKEEVYRTKWLRLHL